MEIYFLQKAEKLPKMIANETPMRLSHFLIEQFRTVHYTPYVPSKLYYGITQQIIFLPIFGKDGFALFSQLAT